MRGNERKREKRRTKIIVQCTTTWPNMNFTQTFVRIFCFTIFVNRLNESGCAVRSQQKRNFDAHEPKINIKDRKTKVTKSIAG